MQAPPLQKKPQYKKRNKQISPKQTNKNPHTKQNNPPPQKKTKPRKTPLSHFISHILPGMRLLMRLSCGFCLSVYLYGEITFINLLMLSQLCISGMTNSWWWWMIFMICSWTIFAKFTFLLVCCMFFCGHFAFVFIEGIGLFCFYSVLCLKVFFTLRSYA